MGKAKADVPRWRRGHHGQVGTALSRRDQDRLVREVAATVVAAAAHMPDARDRKVAAPRLAGQKLSGPAAKVMARTGTYRFRLHLVPFAWLGLLLAAGLGGHKLGAGPGVVAVILIAGSLIVGSRHLSRFARKSSWWMAGLTVALVPLMIAFGWDRPLPLFVLGAWLAVTIPWCHHYRIRPQQPDDTPLPDDDVLIWDRYIAAKLLPGTYLTTRQEIPAGRKWTVMLPMGDKVPADVISNWSRIAGAFDKPRTEVYIEPYPDSRESRAILTVLKRDTLARTVSWDGTGIDTETGCAAIARYGDGQPALIRLFARRDGVRHGLIAGATGSGKSYLLDLIIRICIQSGFIIPVVLDPQEGQSLPYWRDKVLYAAGVEECMTLLRGLQAGMLDRSKMLSRLKWNDEDGHPMKGMDFFDPFVTDLPIVLIIGDEYPVLLTDPVYGNEAIRLTADIGKRGRKTGVALWPVAQVPSLSELGDQVVRSMLVGGNVVCLRTGDRVSAGMIGLDADPSTLPRYFADGKPTYGLGYVIGPDQRQAPARTLMVPSQLRRSNPDVPQLDERFAAAVSLGMSAVAARALADQKAAAVAAGDTDIGPGRSAADAVWEALQAVPAGLDRGSIIERVGIIATDKWGKEAPFRMSQVTTAIDSLCAGLDDGRKVTRDAGKYLARRLHVVGTTTGTDQQSGG